MKTLYLFTRAQWADSSRQRKDFDEFLLGQEIAEGFAGASVEAALNGLRVLR